MKLYRHRERVFVARGGKGYRPTSLSFDGLFRESDPAAWLRSRLETDDVAETLPGTDEPFLPPIESQEVWAAGVTYFRSREARMEESAREADVYDRVYSADRPELFFKATPHRVVGHRDEVAVRRDSKWNVPEAELALAVNRDGVVFGYTIGNDMSSRSIEGENPLYLPQAKIYDRSCALGPCLLVTDEPLAGSTEIRLRVTRAGETVFDGATRLSEMKRKPEDLVRYLFQESSFPDGCYLLTGTGIVPDAELTLERGDEIAITIEPIGTLENRVR